MVLMGMALTPIHTNMALITLRTDQLFIRGRIIIMGTEAMAVIAMTGEINTTVVSTVKGGGTDFFRQDAHHACPPFAVPDMPHSATALR